MDPVWFFLLVMDILIYESDRHFSSLVLCRMNKYCILWMTIKTNHSHACPDLLGNTGPVERRRCDEAGPHHTPLFSMPEPISLHTLYYTVTLSFLFFHFSQAALVLSSVAFVSLTQPNSHGLWRWWQYSRHPQILCLSILYLCTAPFYYGHSYPILLRSCHSLLFFFFVPLPAPQLSWTEVQQSQCSLSLSHTHALVPDHGCLPLERLPRSMVVPQPWCIVHLNAHGKEKRCHTRPCLSKPGAMWSIGDWKIGVQSHSRIYCIWVGRASIFNHNNIQYLTYWGVYSMPFFFMALHYFLASCRTLLRVGEDS